jgi:hypothetical protein
MKVSDTDLLWSLLSVVGALAERLTGEKLVILIPQENHAIGVWTVFPSSTAVRWKKPGEAGRDPVVVIPHEGYLAPEQMPAEPHVEPLANWREPV